MKTKISLAIIFLASICVTASAANRSGNKIEGPSKSGISEVSINLAPETPSFAAFDDDPNYDLLLPSSIISLAPVTPESASFDDSSTDAIFILEPSNQDKPDMKQKGTLVHPSFPVPCDAKYGCGI
jgi:hypothetical protein